jgi:cyclic di-GMP phosphodiesterase
MKPTTVSWAVGPVLTPVRTIRREGGTFVLRSESASDRLSWPATGLYDRELTIMNHARILIVDDCAINRQLLARSIEADGHTALTTNSVEDAFAQIAAERPDLILMDVMMPGRDGFDACRELKRHSSTRLIPVVLVTALDRLEDKIRGLESGADDFLTKPVNAAELLARVRSLLRIKQYTAELESAEAVMLTLAQTVEARDSYTQGHCSRLAEQSVTLGRTLGLDQDDLEVLSRGAVLHDIGKIGVPDAVLLKSGTLSTAEYDVVKQHTVIGDRLCANLQSFRHVRPIVRHHHERLDGSGYPDRLRGDTIPLFAQIIGLVDVFDALTSARPYKPAYSTDRAYEELRDEARRGWRRADLVDAFVTARALQ